MTERQIGDQTVRFDRDATAAVYAGLEHGFAERCGCVLCRNFAAQRDAVYPASFRAVLEDLGVDVHKEGEAFVYGPVADGCYLYGGWFYLVGEIVVAGESCCIAPDSHHFDYFFKRSTPPMVAVEFTAHLKWVLEESFESGRHSATRG